MSRAEPQRTSAEVLGSLAPVLAGLRVDAPPEAAWRHWRWVVEISPEVNAYVADDDDAWERLEAERKLLGRLGTATTLRVPAVVTTAPLLRVQVRRKVRGITGYPVEHLVFGSSEPLKVDRYHPDCPMTEYGRRFAHELGRAVAELQRCVPPELAGSLGLKSRDYLGTLDAIDLRLAEHPELAEVRSYLTPLRTWFLALPPSPVLTHGDLQAHNVAVDPETGALGGIFDFDDAVVGHRLEDFKYLPSFGLRFTQEALHSYETAGGGRASLEHVGRFHIFAAFEHFLFVADDSPRWREIETWCRNAIVRFLPDPGSGVFPVIRPPA